MRSLFTLPASVLAVALMTAPVLAQDADLDMGQGSEAAPQVGQTYKREEIGDWNIDCVKGEEGQEEPCQMTQLMTREDGNPIATAAFFKTPEGSQAAAGATIMVPLETFLPAGLLLNVDGNEDKVYNFSFCNPNGCVARVGFTAEELAAFKGGKTANLTIRPAAAADVAVPMTLSLTGFTKAFDAVTAVPGAQQGN
ncbi:invasion associated locus B family protein [Oceanicola sp. S124]|uniref:invasion associated locus B family protein n=1 Tax=Oceanicola sp. S124 TaxID=1042378 RepID=UPI0002557DE0|nr:invasion associated locus B family protein [Oceanicola sp. S124]